MERTNTYLNNLAFILLMLFALVLMLSNALAEVLAASILAIWIAQTLAYRRRDWLGFPLFKPIIALIGIKAIVLITSGYHGHFGAAFEQLALPLIYFIIPSIVVTGERRRKVAWLLVAGAALAAGIGIIKYYLDIEDRTSSLVSGCYTLAGYLVLVLAVLIPAMAYSKKIKEKIFYGLIAWPLYVGLILTFTRAGYLAAGVFTFILGVFKDRRVFLPAILAIALVYYLSPKAVDILSQRFNMVNTAKFYSHRDILLDMAWDKIDDVKYFGEGLNSFPIAADFSTDLNRQVSDYDSWHNMYIEILFDAGPLALIFLIWLFYAQIRYSFAKFRKTKDDEQKYYQMAFLLVIFSVLTLGMFTNPLRDPIISMAIWLLLGLSVV